MKLFNKTQVSIEETHAFDPIVLDYLHENNFLKPYYSQPCSLSGIKAKADERRQFPVDRNVLHQVLHRQYARVGEGQMHAVVRRNLDRLLDEKVFTVTTGHQLNLFSGPLYFIYKIITTINLAVKLENESGLGIVPVYWMASEDHDMAEIDHVRIFNRTIQWKTAWKGAAGRSNCEGIDSCIDEMASALEQFASVREITSWLKTCYAPDRSLADATRMFVNSLFGSYGLVILDPDEAELKSKCKEIFLDDLINHHAFAKVQDSSAALGAKYNIQVHPREINLFYLSEDYRKRIVKSGSAFEVMDRPERWNPDHLSRELQDHPERFSPNVVLRPMVQELVLPNLVTIGGPAEISYWLQYKSAFDFYKISFPVLLLRRSALIIDERALSRLDKYDIQLQDLFLTYDEWVKKYLSGSETSDFSIEDEVKHIESELEKISLKIPQSDPPLRAGIEAEKARIQNSIQAIREKILRSQKKKNETTLNQIRKLKENLFPENSLQERVDNIIPYYAQFGIDIIQELVDALDPLDHSFIILSAKNKTGTNG